jgi:lytic murein transglycosylase
VRQIVASARAPAWLRPVALALLIQMASPAAAADLTFRAFIESLRAEAAAAPYGVSKSTFDAAFAGVEPDLALPDLVLPGREKAPPRGQAEFIKPPQAYLDRRLLSQLADTGRGLARKHDPMLARIEREIGVERHVVLAIWGRETAFGNHKLPHYAIRVLATQAWVGRRKELFRSELLWALKMLEQRIATRETMRSSWAGAMGLTQFMPSEFFSSARDIDGGAADLFNSVPDALASAANQLRLKGWISGLPWGLEVKVPASGDCALEGPGQARPLAEWARLGFKLASGSALPAAHARAEAYLMSPGGAFGPAFLVTENYKVIRRYNMSDLYATFVGNLADRIAGGGDFNTPWRDLRQLTEKDVEAIQRGLARRGFPMEKFDGKVGSNTRAQIGAYQRAERIAVECWPTEGLLRRLGGG